MKKERKKKDHDRLVPVAHDQMVFPFLSVMLEGIRAHIIKENEIRSRKMFRKY